MTNAKWYQLSGKEGDVVISTRIRLARNLTGRPFPAGMTAEQKKQMSAQVREALQEALPDFRRTAEGATAEFDYLDMHNMLPRDAMSMVERHLISPEFAQCEEGSGLLLSRDESVSIMLGEEDHLRLQVMRAGLDLDAAYTLADRLDSLLDERLHFAFDDRLGYLTQCPTNLGTGMRASIMLHLPALQEQGLLQQLANTVSKLGLTIRGLYGEGSKSEGAIYQLSNQVTLGISEQAAIENLKGIAAQIIREERGVREQMRQNPHFEDRIWRSLGILRAARLLTHDEFMALISNVRIGISLGVIDEVGLDVISDLISLAQPATLMASAGQDLEAGERDQLRAQMVRERLAPTV